MPGASAKAKIFFQPFNLESLILCECRINGVNNIIRSKQAEMNQSPVQAKLVAQSLIVRRTQFLHLHIILQCASP